MPFHTAAALRAVNTVAIDTGGPYEAPTMHLYTARGATPLVPGDFTECLFSGYAADTPTPAVRLMPDGTEAIELVGAFAGATASPQVNEVVMGYWIGDGGTPEVVLDWYDLVTPWPMAGPASALNITSNPGYQAGQCGYDAQS